MAKTKVMRRRKNQEFLNSKRMKIQTLLNPRRQQFLKEGLIK